jgi:hypothetical protein
VIHVAVVDSSVSRPGSGVMQALEAAACLDRQMVVRTMDGGVTWLPQHDLWLMPYGQGCLRR